MRIFGILLLLAGLGLGIGWPWAQVNFLGNEKEKVVFSDLRSKAVKTQSVVLEPVDSPVRVRFQAEYLVDGKLPPSWLHNRFNDRIQPRDDQLTSRRGAKAWL